jgi:uncharacterized protein (TIGR03066 family)
MQRFILLAGLSLILTGCGRYETEGRIVGKWEWTEAATNMTLEFAKNGKVQAYGHDDSDSFYVKGTYRFLDENTFSVTTTPVEKGGLPTTQVNKIESLSHDKMVTINDQNQRIAFCRVD